MRYKIIASGSKGNALLIEEGALTILIDCGVPYSKLKDIKVDAVFLTHQHSDHFKARTISKIADNRPISKFVTAPHLYEKLTDAGISTRAIAMCKVGEAVEVRKAAYRIKAECFSLVHDVENVGWKIDIYAPDESHTSLLYATDTASIDHISYPGLDYYFLEANYEDEEIEQRIAEKLANGEYSYELRARENHLSKAKADEWLTQNASDESVFIYMHQHECGGSDDGN